MKKVISMLVIVFCATFVMTGCDLLGEKGAYQEGTYFGYDEESGTTAAVYVDAAGMVKSVAVDQYQSINCQTETSEEQEYVVCTPTSKRILGISDDVEGDLPWYIQAEIIAEEVIKEQNLEWVDFRYMNEAGEIVETMPENQTTEDMIFTDSVADVEIPVIDIYNAINHALEEAK
jgi:hypothetical protein